MSGPFPARPNRADNDYPPRCERPIRPSSSWAALDTPIQGKEKRDRRHDPPHSRTGGPERPTGSKLRCPRGGSASERSCSATVIGHGPTRWWWSPGATGAGLELQSSANRSSVRNTPIGRPYPARSGQDAIQRLLRRHCCEWSGTNYRRNSARARARARAWPRDYLNAPQFELRHWRSSNVRNPPTTVRPIVEDRYPSRSRKPSDTPTIQTHPLPLRSKSPCRGKAPQWSIWHRRSRQRCHPCPIGAQMSGHRRLSG